MIEGFRILFSREFRLTFKDYWSPKNIVARLDANNATHIIDEILSLDGVMRVATERYETGAGIWFGVHVHLKYGCRPVFIMRPTLSEAARDAKRATAQVWGMYRATLT